MTDCGQEEQGLDSAQRLVVWVFVLSLHLSWTYFLVRVAWDILVSCYASTGQQNTFFLIFGSLMYLGVQAATKPADVSGIPTTSQSLRLQANYVNRTIFQMLIFLFLTIMAVVLAVCLDKSRLSLQIFPIQILLLACALNNMDRFPQLVIRAIQRKLKAGSILPSAEMCTCRKKDRSWLQLTPLPLRLLTAAVSLLNATLWTWLIIFHCYQRHSPFNQSIWVMLAFWWVVSLCWLGVVGGVMSIIRPSTSDHRESEPLPSC